MAEKSQDEAFEEASSATRWSGLGLPLAHGRSKRLVRLRILRRANVAVL